jgi:DNA modification methylase
MQAQEEMFNQEVDWADQLPLLNQPRSLKDFCNKSYACGINLDLDALLKTDSRIRERRDAILNPHVVAAGKNTYVYDTHSYHTKVPPAAIVDLICQYTDKNDLVLDPFCGSGMTGVASLQAGRSPILSDLSPAATFIAYNYLSSVQPFEFEQAFLKILASLQEEDLTLYGTACDKCGKIVSCEYTVWSYNVTCPICAHLFNLWDVARDEKPTIKESKILSVFPCPSCGRRLEKRSLKRIESVPVQIGFKCCGRSLQESKKIPDAGDLQHFQDMNSIPINEWFPQDHLPNGVNTRQAINHGIVSLQDLYTRRNLRAIAKLWNLASRWESQEISLKLLFTLTSLYQRVTRLSEFRFWGGSGNMANYNVPMIFNEQNVFRVFKRKSRDVKRWLEIRHALPEIPYRVSTQSATDLSNIPNDSIDYVFTDPPFGANINYSEMNFIWESWLGLHTDNTNEVIINRVQGKTAEHYKELMTRSLREIHRVLKPGRWLSIVFHNSSASVWNVLQEAIDLAGFEVDNTQTLDKKHGTFKQFVSDNTVGYDIILSCQKRTAKLRASKIYSAQGIESQVREFICSILGGISDGYIARYAHVDRKSELDTRKMYSEWLQMQLTSHNLVKVDYDQFRILVHNVIVEKFPTFELTTNGKS